MITIPLKTDHDVSRFSPDNHKLLFHSLLEKSCYEKCGRKSIRFKGEREGTCLVDGLLPQRKQPPELRNLFLSLNSICSRSKTSWNKKKKSMKLCPHEIEKNDAFFEMN